MNYSAKYSMNKPYTPNFRAIQVAEYKTPVNNKIRVYELEKRDLPFIEDFSSDMDSYIRENKIENKTSRQMIMDTSFKVAKDVLKSSDLKKAKTHIFIAECKGDICGILVGNLLKRSPENVVEYTSRKNASKKETELNWFTTWNPKNNKNKGVGKILLSEYINTLKKDKFKKVFIQAEIPEYSYAVDFYKSMGFKELSWGRKESYKIEYNKDVLPSLQNLNDFEVIPMLGSLGKINKSKRQVFENYKRQQLSNASIDLYSVIK